jgi:hypothetical protein
MVMIRMAVLPLNKKRAVLLQQKNRKILEAAALSQQDVMVVFY